jgi:hypothetical protein
VKLFPSHDRNASDVHDSDFVVINGKKMRPPKFYDKLLEKKDPEKYEYVKMAREEHAKQFHDNNTRERLDVREQVKSKQLERLVRTL